MGVTNHRLGTAAASVRASTRLTCMLPVKDMVRACRFHEHVLGLAPPGAKPDAQRARHGGGTGPALFPKHDDLG